MREVVTEAQWEMLRRFNDHESRDKDWYDPEATEDRLHAMSRFVTEAVGATWYYVSPRDDERILAKLGVFQRESLRRFRDVMTATDSRRQGLARALMSPVIRESLLLEGCTGLCLCADREDIAIGLYPSLGFVDLGQTVTLMTYPVR